MPSSTTIGELSNAPPQFALQILSERSRLMTDNREKRGFTKSDLIDRVEKSKREWLERSVKLSQVHDTLQAQIHDTLQDRERSEEKKSELQKIRSIGKNGLKMRTPQSALTIGRSSLLSFGRIYQRNRYDTCSRCITTRSLFPL